MNRTYPVPNRIKGVLTARGTYSIINNRICNQCELKWRKGECVHDSINIVDEEYKDVTDVDGRSSLNVTCL